MLKIMIKDPAITTNAGTSRRTGRGYSIRSQTGWVELPGKAFPVEVRITLGDEQPAFGVGDYTIAAGAFYVDRFGELKIDLAKMNKVSVGNVGAARVAG